MNPITSFLVFVCVLAGLAVGNWVNLSLAFVFFAAAVVIALALKMANAWQKFVILRLGKLQSVKGPGMFVIIPIIDNVVAVIDGRIQTTAFNAEQALTSVEIRDVAIPVALQDAMSRQAQAEREKQARVILGSAEAAIAGKFVEAAEIYAGHPEALQLRAMHIIYETTKERGATILIPSSMVDSLNPSTATLALALASKAAPGPEAA